MRHLRSSAAALLAAWACGGPSGKAPVVCEEGREGCACFRNGTCDEGLDCRSELCVNPETEETGGTSGMGDTGGAPAIDAGAGGTGDASGGTSSSTGGAGNPSGGASNPSGGMGGPVGGATDGGEPSVTGGAPVMCEEGTEGCACYANDTCNDGLECLSGLCVDSGTGGTGSGGNASTGGTSPSGGSNTGGIGAPIYADVQLIASCTQSRGEVYNGAWYTGAGPSSTLSPVHGEGEFPMVSGGYVGSAAHVSGSMAVDDYAHIGHNMLLGAALFDASAYDGISFHAKAGQPIQVMVGIGQENNEPSYGLCTPDVTCYQYPSVFIDVGTTWTRFVVPFVDMKSDPPELVPVTPARVKHFQFSMQPGSFDFWIDELYFVAAQ